LIGPGGPQTSIGQEDGMANLTGGGAALDQAANPYADGCGWIDGEYVPIADARIPILDAGFVRSDVTYDVVGVWKGRFFRIEDHLDRVLRSCELLRLDPGMTRAEMRETLFECVRRSGLRDSYVEIIVSRGIPTPGDRDPRNWKNRVYALAIPYMWIVRPEVQERGTDVAVARDTRRFPIGSFDPSIKNFQWGDFTRALFEVYEREAWLPILTDGEGHITEGPGFNVFVLSGKKLSTPASGILHGITRKTVLEIVADMDLEVEVGEVPTGRLYDADEIFLSSTAGGIFPVATLDGEPVGAERPGPITKAVKDRYWDLHTDPALSDEVDYPD
jgi:branched-subunit amino acid aminotransferase/4-amino-4-deoxychorismate lyase